MKKMKRVKSVFVVFLCLAALVMGCKASGGGTGASGKTARVGEKGSLPLATTKPVLTMYIAGGINEQTTSFDYNDNKQTKKIVDETGIDMRIIATPLADAQERLNIMLNTGEYPDLIYPHNLGFDLEYYAKQGTIIPLDAYDPLSFPGIKRIFEEFPQAALKLTGSDGKMYALPYARSCLWCNYSFGRMWFYMPWARDAGFKAPETLDEFTEFLRFAKNGDPNGNGRKDELGIVFNKDDAENFIGGIAKAYMPFVFGGLALENNRIVEQYRDPRFREALKYMAGLYKEGLIERDSFSMTSDQVTGIVRSEPVQAAVVGASWINAHANPGTERFAEYFYVPALKGPSGEQWATNIAAWGDTGPILYITDKCKDPELALALFDYMNSMEYYSKGSTPADPGALGMNGKPALYKPTTSYGQEPVNSRWFDNLLFQAPTDWVYGAQQDGVAEMQRFLQTGDKSLAPLVAANNAYTEYMFWYISTDAQKHAMPDSLFIPPQVLNDVDNARAADINAVLDPFKIQTFVEFITGTRNINSDADWNAYLAELDRLGSPEMVAIRQKYIK